MWAVAGVVEGCKEAVFGVQGDRGRSCSVWSFLCALVSKVEGGHSVCKEAVGSGKRCNCICASGFIHSGLLFLRRSLNFWLFFHRRTVVD